MSFRVKYGKQFRPPLVTRGVKETGNIPNRESSSRTNRLKRLHEVSFIEDIMPANKRIKLCTEDHRKFWSEQVLKPNRRFDEAAFLTQVDDGVDKHIHIHLVRPSDDDIKEVHPIGMILGITIPKELVAWRTKKVDRALDYIKTHAGSLRYRAPSLALKHSPRLRLTSPVTYDQLPKNYQKLIRQVLQAA